MPNGLILLDKPHELPVKKHKMYKHKGLVHGPYFYLVDKPKGVEPGFLAVEIGEQFRQRVEDQFKQKFTDINACSAYLSGLSQLQLAPFADRLIEEGQGKIPPTPTLPTLKLLLFKQDYHEPNFRGKVVPPLRRLAATHNISNRMTGVRTIFKYGYSLLRRFRSRYTKENRNAIFECLANEIAGAYGMPVQNQYLILSSYNNGAPKIMTACEWEKDLQMLEGKINGSLVYSAYENYLIQCDAENKPIVVDGFYKSDTSFSNLGHCLALFIAQGDRDVFGSQAQNKGRHGNFLYGFDFGHTYRRQNLILDTLKDDFSFTQPKSATKKFKNLSICYDSLLSERMAGMFFIYKMMADQLPKEFTAEVKQKIKAALSQYPKAVRDQFDNIKPNSLNSIFDAYHQKFQGLADGAPSDNGRREFLEYAMKINKAKNWAIEANLAMLKIFKDRMQLSPQEVDLLDNLTKFTSETSMLSSNGRVALAHLRITQGPNIHWEMHKEGDKIILKAQTPRTLQVQALKSLRKYLGQMKINTPPQISGGIQFTLTKEQLTQWISAFQEKNINMFKLTGTVPLKDLDLEVDKSSKEALLERTQLKEVITGVAELRKQRQLSPLLDTQIVQLSDKSNQLKLAVSVNSADSISAYARGALQELKAIKDQRNHLLDEEKLEREICMPSPVTSTSGESIFHSSTLLSSARITPTDSSRLKPNLKSQQFNLTLQKNDPEKTAVQALLADKNHSTNVSFPKKSKAFDIAHLWATGLPDHLRSQFPPGQNLITLFKSILETLRENNERISKKIIEEALTEKLGSQTTTQVQEIAAYLFSTYKRNTEQLDPYKALSDTVDPYESNLYFPNDLFIRIAANHVDQYVKNLDGHETPHIVLTKAWDPHYVEAVMLYCNLKGYNCSNFSGWEMNPRELSEKFLYFKNFYNERFRDLQCESLDSRSPESKLEP